MSVARNVARCRCLVLVGMVACAPTPSSPRPTPLRSHARGEAPPGPHVAVASAVRVSTPVPPPPPPAPPPPVVDAEQRAILDALEAVAKELEAPRAPADLAAALGTIDTTTLAHREIEVAPRHAALSRIRVDRGRRPTENHVEVTVRTPTNAAIIGTRFGVLGDEGFLREFGDLYWLTTCRPLSDGGHISIDVWLDGTIEPLEAEPTSVVFLERWSPSAYRTCAP